MNVRGRAQVVRARCPERVTIRDEVERARARRRQRPDEVDRAVYTVGGRDRRVRARRYGSARLLAKRAGDAVERVQVGLRVTRQPEAVRGGRDRTQAVDRDVVEGLVRFA